MRIFLKTPRRGGRSERLREKYRSRFKDGGSRSGNRDLIRFRRNRQILVRDFTSFSLWLAIAFMMVPLGRSLWRLSAAHFHDPSSVWHFVLPGFAALAMIVCLWRARSGWREIQEVRREQAKLLRALRQEGEDETEV